MLILVNNNDDTVVMLAIRKGNTEIVKLLLEKGVNFNDKNN